MRPVSELPKKICPGSGATVEKLELRQRFPADSGFENQVFAQCPHCTRVLVPTRSGKLHQHQPRNAATASLDRTRDTLWNAAKPIEGDPVTDDNAMTRPPTCEFCGKKYSNEGSRDRHENAKHPAEVAARVTQVLKEADAEFFAELEKRFEEKLQSATKEKRWGDVAILGNWYQTTYLIFPEALEALNG